MDLTPELQWSVPSVVDSLNRGQRKILFTAFKNNLDKQTRVYRLASYAKKQAAYNCGQQSTENTITNMAQDFLGSNNLNLLDPCGYFGAQDFLGSNNPCDQPNTPEDPLDGGLLVLWTRLLPVTRLVFPVEDDILLNYLELSGQSIEPIWYIPIIPMVLVNGSRGFNSNVPSYNPRDIIANLRRLLNYERVEPMDPWYRGFKGRIEKISTTVEGSTYSTTGVIEVVDETKLLITQLPIHCWTKDYRYFLKSLSKNRKNKTNEFRIKLIKDIGCDEMNLQSEFILEVKNMEKITQESLEKKLNLITTVGTTNMHLFDRNGINIRKYKTPEEILEEFFGLRLEYYVKRKKAQLDSLDLDLWKITNKVRFILSVGHGDITVINREADDLVLELYRKGFAPFPTSSESPEGGKRVLASDYEYLLSMPISSMAREKLHELYAEKAELEEKIKEVRRSKPRLLWIKDLDALEAELDAAEEDKYVHLQQRLDELKRADIERLETLRNRKKPTKKTTANDGEAGVCKPVKSKPATQKKGKPNTEASVIEIDHDEAPQLDARPANNVVDSSSAHTGGLQKGDTCSSKGASKTGAGRGRKPAAAKTAPKPATRGTIATRKRTASAAAAQGKNNGAAAVACDAAVVVASPEKKVRRTRGRAATVGVAGDSVVAEPAAPRARLTRGNKKKAQRA